MNNVRFRPGHRATKGVGRHNLKSNIIKFWYSHDRFGDYPKEDISLSLNLGIQQQIIGQNDRILHWREWKTIYMQVWPGLI